MGEQASERDEGVLDPWVAAWLEANPLQLSSDYTPEYLAMTRSPVGPPPTREVAGVEDTTVDGVGVRVYDVEDPAGLVVYIHGGGHVMGSVGLMDGVARELAHGGGAVVVSVEYRLAPEHPYPAGLDDVETVVRWVASHGSTFGVTDAPVVVAGESAGGNLAAAVALRLRDRGGPPLAGQVLIYPMLAGSSGDFPSRAAFAGMILDQEGITAMRAAYAGGRDIERDPYAMPLRASDVSGLPPALVILGGCDYLRDEGRAYAARLREAGVAVEETCYPGQPHGFVNFGFPAAADAFDRIGGWLRSTFQGGDA